jgi:threonine dehydrogenase-like Zn-dependent dehydrogenase
MLGDSVPAFAAEPIGLCAVLGAKLHGAGSIIAVDANPHRLEMAIQMGATHTIDIRKEDSVAEIPRLIRGRGVDVAIESLSLQRRSRTPSG